MRVKEGVSLDGLHIAMRIVLVAAENVWKDFGQECVITAGTKAFDHNGNLIHHPGSLHPFGRALDFRTFYFHREVIPRVAKLLRETLGPAYQVIVESNHIHVEYDPIT